MKRTTIFITEPQEGHLQVESQRTGLSVAELIRRAIDQYLDRGQIVKVIDQAIEDLKAEKSWTDDTSEGGEG